MADDGASRDESTAGDGGFTDEYELATEADVIDVEEPGESDTAESEAEEGAVAGSFAPEIEVSPDTPELENVVFVSLGVFIAIISLGRMFLGAEMYAPATLGGVIAVIAVGTAVLYGLFVRTGDA